MKPAWMIEDEKETAVKSQRAAKKRVFIDRSEVIEDQEREAMYQQVMEDTGRSY